MFYMAAMFVSINIQLKKFPCRYSFIFFATIPTIFRSFFSRKKRGLFSLFFSEINNVISLFIYRGPYGLSALFYILLLSRFLTIRFYGLVSLFFFTASFQLTGLRAQFILIIFNLSKRITSPTPFVAR